MPDTIFFKSSPIRRSPIPGESLLSYITRVAEANYYDSIRWMVREYRPTDWDIASWPEQVRENVSSLCGIELAEFNSLSYTKVGSQSRHRDERCFLGSQIPSRFLRLSAKRYCPLCLRRDLPHHAIFDVKHVAACPWHGCRLEESCHRCGAITKWGTGSLGRCAICRADLRSAPEVMLSVQQLATSVLIAQSACLHDLTDVGMSLPERTHSFSIGQSIEFICALNRLHLMIEGKPYNYKSENYANVLSPDAIFCFSDWPDAFYGILSRLADVSKPVSNREFVQTIAVNSLDPRNLFSKFYRHMLNRRVDVEPFSYLSECIREFTLNYNADVFVLRSNRFISKADLSDRRVVSLGSVANRHKFDVRTLDKFANSGKFDSKNRTAKSISKVVVKHEVENFLANYHFTQAGAAKRLGVSVERLGNFISDGLLRPDSSFDGVYGRLVFSERDLATMEEVFLYNLDVDEQYPGDISAESAFRILYHNRVSVRSFFRGIEYGIISPRGHNGAVGIGGFLFNRGETGSFAYQDVDARLALGGNISLFGAAKLLGRSEFFVRRLLREGLIKLGPLSSRFYVVADLSSTLYFHKEYIFAHEIAHITSLRLEYVQALLHQQAIPAAEASRDYRYRFFHRQQEDWGQQGMVLSPLAIFGGPH